MNFPETIFAGSDRMKTYFIVRESPRFRLLRMGSKSPVLACEIKRLLWFRIADRLRFSLGRIGIARFKR